MQQNLSEKYATKSLREICNNIFQGIMQPNLSEKCATQSFGEICNVIFRRNMQQNLSDKDTFILAGLTPVLRAVCSCFRGCSHIMSTAVGVNDISGKNYRNPIN